MCDKADDLRSNLFTGTEKVFGACGKLYAIPAVSIIATIIAIALGVVLGAIGLDPASYALESSQDELWIQRGTRMESERGFHAETWGLMNRQILIMQNAENVNGSANPVSLDATIDTMSAILVFDESEKCATYDGTDGAAARIEAKCASLSEGVRKNSLYCMSTCNTIAGKGNKPVGFTDDATGLDIDERQVCDTLGRADPDARNFLPSKLPASPAYVEEFKTTSLYPLALHSLLSKDITSATHTRLGSAAQAVWTANKNKYAALVFDAIKNDQGAKTIQENALVALKSSLANISFTEYGVAFSGADDTLLRAEALDHTTTIVAKAILAAYASWLPQSVGGEGNSLGFLYQELAACAAKSMENAPSMYKAGGYMNQIGMNMPQYGANMAMLAAAEAAALASLKANMGGLSTTATYTMTRDLLPSSAPKTWSEKRGCPTTTTQPPAAPPSPPSPLITAAAGAGVGTYFAYGGDVYVGSDTLRTEVKGLYGGGKIDAYYNFSDAEVTTVVLGILQSNYLAAQQIVLKEKANVTLTAAETAVVTSELLILASTGGAGFAAYNANVAAAVPNADARAVLSQSMAGDLAFLSIMSTYAPVLPKVGQAFIQIPIAAMAYEQVRAHFVVPTLDFTARPLPRNWGIDRFPCTVASLTDVFREGDYALPFNIKQLAEVSMGVAGYISGYARLGLPDCGAQAISGGLETAYSNSLGFEYTSKDSRPTALNLAECAMGEGLMTLLGTNSVEEAVVKNADDKFTPSVKALAIPVASAYFAGGGSVYSCGNDLYGTVASKITTDYPSTYAGTCAMLGATPGPELTMTKEEFGTSTMALFGTFSQETGGSGNVATITDPAAFGRVALAFIATHDPTVASNATIYNTMVAGFAASVPSMLACNTNVNTTDFQCMGGCSGVAFNQALKTLDTPLCVSDVACQQGAYGMFAGTVGGEVYSQYGQYFSVVLNTFADLGAVGSMVQSLAVATATGLALEVQAGDQVVSLSSSLFVAMGHRYRPTYGSHRSVALQTDATLVDSVKAVYMSNAEEAIVEVLPTVSDALQAYYLDTDADTEGRQRIPQTSCIRTHKFPDGRLLRGCMMTWLSTFLPPDLVVADIDLVGANGTNLEDINAGGVSRVGFHRTVLYDFSEGHWLGAAVLDDYLNETTDNQRRGDLHRKQEAVESALLEPKWARAVNSSFGPGEPFESETLFFLVASTTSAVLAGATNVAFTSIIICILVMVVMVGLVMTNFESNVESHFFVGILGMAVMAVSTMSAMGASGWLFGIPFTPLSARVAPFIILGVGVDDMLVISKALINHAKSGNDVAKTLRHTLAESGPSVTFTTLTNLTAFWIASTFRINIVKWFCQVMCVAVVTNWLFLFLLFVPIVALDSLRVKRDMPEFCCIRAPSCKKYLDVTYFVKTYYGPFLMNNITRAVVVVVFFAFFIFQLVFGLQNIQTGLRNSDIMPPGPASDFYYLSETHFTAYPLDMVTDSRAFEKNQTQIDIQMGMRAIAGSKWITSYSEADASSYINSFARYADANKVSMVEVTAPADCGDPNADLFATTSNYTVIAEDEFYYAFAAYLRGLGVFGASAFICENTTSHERVNCFKATDAYPAVPNRTNKAIHTNDVILIAAFDSQYLKNQKDTEAITDAITDVRDRTDSCFVGEDHTSFPTGYTHLYWDQYLHTTSELMQVVGFAVLGVFVVTFLFQFSMRSSLLIALVVIMVVVELFGVIPESDGMQLNAFSVVNLAIGVGLAIELTAHTVHQFLAEQGTKRERVIKALEFMAWPMIFGGLTTLITSAFLATSDIPFIRQYYFEMFFAMTIICLANGMVLVPVLLSLPYIGDSSLISEEMHKENHEDTDDEPKKLHQESFGF